MKKWNPFKHKIVIKVWALIISTTFILPFVSFAFDSNNYGLSLGYSPINHLGQTISLPQKMGTVTKTYQGSTKTVLVIQDLHCHEEVQKNIASMINYFNQKHNLKLIGQEGAFGEVDTSQVDSFPVKRIKKEITGYFVKQGKLTGAEYQAINSSQKMHLVGLEDKLLYNKSLSDVQSFLNSESQGYVYDLRELFDELKPSLYTKKLISFDQEYQRYRQGKLDAMRFAAHLQKWSNKVGLDLRRFSDYRQFITKNTSGDPDKVFEEFDQIVALIKEQLYTNNTQKEFDQYYHRLDIVEKLLNVSVTQEELKDFRDHAKLYRVQSFINFYQTVGVGHSAYSGLHSAVSSDIYQLDHYLNQVKSFYQLADLRSISFVDTLTAAMTNYHQKLAVMVSGGFHNDQILEELESRQISYMAIKPKLTKVNVLNPYFTLIQGKQLPIEQLLEKNQTNIAIRSWLQSAWGNQVIKLAYGAKAQKDKVGLTDAAVREVRDWFKGKWQAIKSGSNYQIGQVALDGQEKLSVLTAEKGLFSPKTLEVIKQFNGRLLALNQTDAAYFASEDQAVIKKVIASFNPSQPTPINPWFNTMKYLVPTLLMFYLGNQLPWDEIFTIFYNQFHLYVNSDYRQLITSQTISYFIAALMFVSLIPGTWGNLIHRLNKFGLLMVSDQHQTLPQMMNSEDQQGRTSVETNRTVVLRPIIDGLIDAETTSTNRIQRAYETIKNASDVLDMELKLTLENATLLESTLTDFLNYPHKNNLIHIVKALEKSLKPSQLSIILSVLTIYAILTAYDNAVKLLGNDGKNLTEFKAVELWVAGSVSRGQFTLASDADLFIMYRHHDPNISLDEENFNLNQQLELLGLNQGKNEGVHYLGFNHFDRFLIMSDIDIFSDYDFKPLVIDPRQSLFAEYQLKLDKKYLSFVARATNKYTEWSMSVLLLLQQTFLKSNPKKLLRAFDLLRLMTAVVYKVPVTTASDMFKTLRANEVIASHEINLLEALYEHFLGIRNSPDLANRVEENSANLMDGRDTDFITIMMQLFFRLNQSNDGQPGLIMHNVKTWWEDNGWFWKDQYDIGVAWIAEYIVSIRHWYGSKARASATVAIIVLLSIIGIIDFTQFDELVSYALAPIWISFSRLHDQQEMSKLSRWLVRSFALINFLAYVLLPWLPISLIHAILFSTFGHLLINLVLAINEKVKINQKSKALLAQLPDYDISQTKEYETIMNGNPSEDLNANKPRTEHILRVKAYRNAFISGDFNYFTSRLNHQLSLIELISYRTQLAKMRRQFFNLPIDQQLAFWWAIENHDIGWSQPGGDRGHEERGKEIAVRIMTEQNIGEGVATLAANIIGIHGRLGNFRLGEIRLRRMEQHIEASGTPLFLLQLHNMIDMAGVHGQDNIVDLTNMKEFSDFDKIFRTIKDNLLAFRLQRMTTFGLPQRSEKEIEKLLVTVERVFGKDRDQLYALLEKNVDLVELTVLITTELAQKNFTLFAKYLKLLLYLSQNVDKDNISISCNPLGELAKSVNRPVAVRAIADGLEKILNKLPDDYSADTVSHELAAHHYNSIFGLPLEIDHQTGLITLEVKTFYEAQLIPATKPIYHVNPSSDQNQPNVSVAWIFKWFHVAISWLERTEMTKKFNTLSSRMIALTVTQRWLLIAGMVIFIAIVNVGLAIVIGMVIYFWVKNSAVYFALNTIKNNYWESPTPPWFHHDIHREWRLKQGDLQYSRMIRHHDDGNISFNYHFDNLPTDTRYAVIASALLSAWSKKWPSLLQNMLLITIEPLLWLLLIVSPISKVNQLLDQYRKKPFISTNILAHGLHDSKTPFWLWIKSLWDTVQFRWYKRSRLTDVLSERVEHINAIALLQTTSIKNGFAERKAAFHTAFKEIISHRVDVVNKLWQLVEQIGITRLYAGQLARLFNTFEAKNLPHHMIALYDRSNNKRFKQSIIIRKKLAQALFEVGSLDRSELVCRRLIAENTLDSYLYIILGNIVNQRARERVRLTTSYQSRDIKRLQRLNSLHQVIALAEQGYLIDFNHAAGIQLATHKFYAAIESQDDNQLEQSLQITKMAYLSAEKAGGLFSDDYAIISTMIQASILLGWDKQLNRAHRVFMDKVRRDKNINDQHIQQLSNNIKKIGVYWIKLSNWNDKQEDIDRSSDIIKLSSRIRNKIDWNYTAHYESAQATVLPKSTQSLFSLGFLFGESKETFIRGTASLNGMIPDLIINQWDFQVSKDILNHLGLLDSDDLDAFNQQIDRFIRKQLNTANLEDKESQAHHEMEDALWAFKKLLGSKATKDYRTNLMKAFRLRQGDCRIHMVKILLFDVWKSHQVNKYLTNAYQAVADNRQEDYTYWREKGDDLSRLYMLGFDTVLAGYYTQAGFNNIEIEQVNIFGTERPVFKNDDQIRVPEEHFWPGYVQLNYDMEIESITSADAFYHRFYRLQRHPLEFDHLNSNSGEDNYYFASDTKAVDAEGVDEERPYLKIMLLPFAGGRGKRAESKMWDNYGQIKWFGWTLGVIQTAQEIKAYAKGFFDSELNEGIDRLTTDLRILAQNRDGGYIPLLMKGNDWLNQNRYIRWWGAKFGTNYYQDAWRIESWPLLPIAFYGVWQFWLTGSLLPIALGTIVYWTAFALAHWITIKTLTEQEIKNAKLALGLAAMNILITIFIFFFSPNALLSLGLYMILAASGPMVHRFMNNYMKTEALEVVQLESFLAIQNLTWRDFGMQRADELKILTNLKRELMAWMNKKQVPIWAQGKKTSESWQTFTLRKAIGSMWQNNNVDIQNIHDSLTLKVTDSQGRQHAIDLHWMNQEEASTYFEKYRKKSHGKDEKASEDWMFGKWTRGPPAQGNKWQLSLPPSLLYLGSNPKERQTHLAAVLSYHQKKATHLCSLPLNEDLNQVQYVLPNEIIDTLPHGSKLGELSLAIQQLHFLNQASAQDSTPKVVFDKDQTFNFNHPLTGRMLYHAWSFFNQQGIDKMVLTARGFESVQKQIIKPIKNLTKIISTKRTTSDSDQTTTALDKVLGPFSVGTTGGNGYYQWNGENQAYQRTQYYPLDNMKLLLIELAALMTMPDLSRQNIEVAGDHVVRVDEIIEDDDELESKATGIVIVPPGDKSNDKSRFDTNKKRRLQQIWAMEQLLKNPKVMMDLIDGWDKKHKGPWIYSINPFEEQLSGQVQDVHKVRILECYRQINLLLASNDDVNLTQTIKADFQVSGRSSINEMAQKGVGILRLIDEKPTAYYGDELGEIEIELLSGISVKVSLNDHSVAKAMADDPNSPIKLIGAISQPQTYMPENVTLPFAAQTVMPDQFVHMLKYTADAWFNMNQASVPTQVKNISSEQASDETKRREMGQLLRAFQDSDIGMTYFQAKAVIAKLIKIASDKMIELQLTPTGFNASSVFIPDPEFIQDDQLMQGFYKNYLAKFYARSLATGYRNENIALRLPIKLNWGAMIKPIAKSMEAYFNDLGLAFDKRVKAQPSYDSPLESENKRGIILAIDIGATGMKAAVYENGIEQSSEWLPKGSEKTKTFNNPEGGSGEEFARQLNEFIIQLSNHVEQDGRRIDGLSILVPGDYDQENKKYIGLGQIERAFGDKGERIKHLDTVNEAFNRLKKVGIPVTINPDHLGWAASIAGQVKEEAIMIIYGTGKATKRLLRKHGKVYIEPGGDNIGAWAYNSKDDGHQHTRLPGNYSENGFTIGGLKHYLKEFGLDNLFETALGLSSDKIRFEHLYRASNRKFTRLEKTQQDILKRKAEQLLDQLAQVEAQQCMHAAEALNVSTFLIGGRVIRGPRGDDFLDRVRNHIQRMENEIDVGLNTEQRTKLGIKRGLEIKKLRARNATRGAALLGYKLLKQEQSKYSQSPKVKIGGRSLIIKRETIKLIRSMPKVKRLLSKSPIAKLREDQYQTIDDWYDEHVVAIETLWTIIFAGLLTSLDAFPQAVSYLVSLFGPFFASHEFILWVLTVFPLMHIDALMRLIVPKKDRKNYTPLSNLAISIMISWATAVSFALLLTYIPWLTIIPGWSIGLVIFVIIHKVLDRFELFFKAIAISTQRLFLVDYLKNQISAFSTKLFHKLLFNHGNKKYFIFDRMLNYSLTFSNKVMPLNLSILLLIADLIVENIIPYQSILVGFIVITVVWMSFISRYYEGNDEQLWIDYHLRSWENMLNDTIFTKEKLLTHEQAINILNRLNVFMLKYLIVEQYTNPIAKRIYSFTLFWIVLKMSRLLTKPMVTLDQKIETGINDLVSRIWQPSEIMSDADKVFILNELRTLSPRVERKITSLLEQGLAQGRYTQGELSKWSNSSDLDHYLNKHNGLINRISLYLLLSKLEILFWRQIKEPDLNQQHIYPDQQTNREQDLFTESKSKLVQAIHSYLIAISSDETMIQGRLGVDDVTIKSRFNREITLLLKKVKTVLGQAYYEVYEHTNEIRRSRLIAKFHVKYLGRENETIEISTVQRIDGYLYGNLRVADLLFNLFRQSAQTIHFPGVWYPEKLSALMLTYSKDHQSAHADINLLHKQPLRSQLLSGTAFSDQEFIDHELNVFEDVVEHAGQNALSRGLSIKNQRLALESANQIWDRTHNARQAAAGYIARLVYQKSIENNTLNFYHELYYSKTEKRAQQVVVDEFVSSELLPYVGEYRILLDWDLRRIAELIVKGVDETAQEGNVYAQVLNQSLQEQGKGASKIWFYIHKWLMGYGDDYTFKEYEKNVSWIETNYIWAMISLPLMITSFYLAGDLSWLLNQLLHTSDGIKVLSLISWLGLFVGSHFNKGTPQENIKAAIGIFLAIALSHLAPLIFVIPLSYAVHWLVNQQDLNINTTMNNHLTDIITINPKQMISSQATANLDLHDDGSDFQLTLINQLANNEAILLRGLLKNMIQIKALPKTINWAAYLLGLWQGTWLTRNQNQLTLYIPTNLSQTMQEELANGSLSLTTQRRLYRIANYVGGQYYKNIRQAKIINNAVASHQPLHRLLQDHQSWNQALIELAAGYSLGTLNKLISILISASTSQQLSKLEIEAIMQTLDPNGKTVQISINNNKIILPAIYGENIQGLRNMIRIIRRIYPTGKIKIDGQPIKFPIRRKMLNLKQAA